MLSPSLAELAARSLAVTLPPATPSIDTLTTFADDGLIRFIGDTSHKCGDRHVESIGNFRKVRKTDVSSSDLYRSVVRPVHVDVICKLLLRITRLCPEFFAT